VSKGIRRRLTAISRPLNFKRYFIMEFTHLHCHSHFSLLDGLSKIDLLVSRTQELGMKSLALTDHGVMYGAVEFYAKCKEAGLKPIIGLETYVAPRLLTDKEGKTDSDYFHLTLLARNETGYKNLILLTTLAHTEGFYYKPRIDLPVLKKYSQGLIALSGCQRGQIPRAVTMGEATGEEVLKKYLDIFSKENFFIEIQKNAKQDKGEEASLNGALVSLAKKNNLGIVATADCHYIYPEDSEAQDVLVCIGTARTVGESDRLDMRGYDLSLRSAEKMNELFYELPEALENTGKIADMCELEIKLDQRYFPKVELPEGKTSEQFLKDLTYLKALEVYGQKGEVSKEILERIDYELDIICKKGFATYFLMVADVVDGAHKIGAITNTRGSAAGSIVGRILGITNVDPLYYELPFERFLTLHRPTPPDIDLDIADNRRDEAIEYITNKYGKDKVAQIITFGTMMARAAVRDVGRALGVSYGKCDRIAKMIPFGKQGFQMTLDRALQMNAELKEAYDRDPETNKILIIAKKLEGCARHASVHAAGIVITPTALTDYMPLQKEPDGERIITQYDMYALDVNASSRAIGVVKLDLLGIRNLSILEAAVSLAEKKHGVQIDIYNLPHPDPKTFKLLSDGHTFGVFQMGSSGMTRYLRELKPSSIFDIMAMIALYRPGPMQFIPDYIKRKHNSKLIKYFDPAFEKILHRTYGILVYQDDLLTIAHDLAGYTWLEVDKFRKAVGKKIPAEMARQKIKFIEGCQKTSGFSVQKAAEIWNWIEPFAAYGFNKAHSASYSVVSYQTAYMKANYPVEFMAAVMTAEAGDEDKIFAAVEECKNMGIQVLPPDVNSSDANFTVVDPVGGSDITGSNTDKFAAALETAASNGTIRFGLSAIKNLGSDVITKAIEQRQADGKFKTLEDFVMRTNTKNLNKKSWEALVKAGALDEFGERGQLLGNTEEVLSFMREQIKAQENGQSSLFGSEVRARLKLKKMPPASKDEILAWEKEHLGMYVSSHPLESYSRVLKTMDSVASLNLEMLGNNKTMGGIISKLKRTLTKKNDPMAFFTLGDLSGNIEVLVFPTVMEKALPFLENDRIVQVRGRLSDKDEELKLIAEEIIGLPSDKDYGVALNNLEKSKSVVLHMPHMAEKNVLEKIKTVLGKHPGNAQVFLSVGIGQTAKKVKTQTKVSVQNGLIAELKKIAEIGKVDVE